jgi:Asp-tRNA(Asn)/Glu-tRNA(Gln) amidotransferase A subunit family amidase
VADQYATAGYVEYLKRPVPTDNSALVSLLLDAGAVLYCKTNVPQTMMVSLMLLGHPYALLIVSDCRLG